MITLNWEEIKKAKDARLNEIYPDDEKRNKAIYCSICLTMCFFGDKIPFEIYEAQTKDFMLMGQVALDNSLARWQVMKKFFKET